MAKKTRIIVINRLLITAIALLFGLSFAAGSALGEVKISGYVKFDLLWDLEQQDGGGTWGDKAPGLDGSKAAATDGSFNMHARQSRITFTSAHDSPMGKITTLIQGDFFGAGGNEAISNSNTFRERHLWIGLGENWNFGVFWGLSMAGLEYFPETLDFGGSAGEPFIRQAQIRYTMPMGANKLQISLENPFSLVFDGTGGTVDNNLADSGLFANAKASKPTLPDLHAHYQLGMGGGSKLGFIFSNYRVRMVNIQVTGTSLDEEVTGTGLAVYGKFGIGGKNNVKFFLGGGAPGRFNSGGFAMGTGNAVVLDDPNDGVNGGFLETIDSTSVIASVQFIDGEKTEQNAA